MRHGRLGRFPTRAHVILNRFDLADSDLLGTGSESRVYAMDAEHVLRIYNDDILWDYVEARHAFYARLAENDLPFAVPEVFSIGAWVGHIYTVEKRMPGQDFGKVLPTLHGAERAKALISYLDVAASLGRVRFPDKPYGELLATSPLQREHWRDYLEARMAQTLVTSRADLEQDVPKFDQVLASIYARLPILGDDPPKCLVHGDYFPANVFIDDQFRISGVGDFSYAVVVGDARMDLAGAVLLMGATTDYCPDDSAFLRRQIAERWGDELLEVVDFYRLYYSIFFSGCKIDDPTTYWWCVENLSAAARD
jgi:aminoglycoside phosphotransferase (APT) family kinase protein